MAIRIDLQLKEWYDQYMSKQNKRIYKCTDCKTVITVETSVHELPESIVCPCDNLAENQGA